MLKVYKGKLIISGIVLMVMWIIIMIYINKKLDFLRRSLIFIFFVIYKGKSGRGHFLRLRLIVILLVPHFGYTSSYSLWDQSVYTDINIILYGYTVTSVDYDQVYHILCVYRWLLLPVTYIFLKHKAIIPCYPPDSGYKSYTQLCGTGVACN